VFLRKSTLEVFSPNTPAGFDNQNVERDEKGNALMYRHDDAYTRGMSLLLFV
jgi:hypothetical protein